MTKIDLHNHTIKSDGHIDPFGVVDMAASHGVEILAITDHDTVAAYTPELLEYVTHSRGVRKPREILVVDHKADNVYLKLLRVAKVFDPYRLRAAHFELFRTLCDHIILDEQALQCQA